MKTTLTRIITKDHLELVGLLYEPDLKTDKVLVHVHGMAGNFYENSFLDPIAKTLTDNGTAFFAFNNRGCEMIKDLYEVKNGERSYVQIGNSFEKFADCLTDISAAIDFVHSKGFSKIHLSGHSLGGPKIAYYASETKDSRLASIIFLSPADMVGLGLADENHKRDSETAQKMIAEGKGDELIPFLVWGENRLSANTFIDLSDKNSKVAIFNFYNPTDSFAVLKSISTPSITITGRKDNALSIPIEDTMKKIKEVMTASPKVETVILGDANHGYLGYEQKLADEVNAWIQRQ